MAAILKRKILKRSRFLLIPYSIKGPWVSCNHIFRWIPSLAALMTDIQVWASTQQIQPDLNWFKSGQAREGESRPFLEAGALPRGATLTSVLSIRQPCCTGHSYGRSHSHRSHHCWVVPCCSRVIIRHQGLDQILQSCCFWKGIKWTFMASLDTHPPSIPAGVASRHWGCIAGISSSGRGVSRAKRAASTSPAASPRWCSPATASPATGAAWSATEATAAASETSSKGPTTSPSAKTTSFNKNKTEEEEEESPDPSHRPRTCSSRLRLRWCRVGGFSRPKGTLQVENLWT